MEKFALYRREKALEPPFKRAKVSGSGDKGHRGKEVGAIRHIYDLRDELFWKEHPYANPHNPENYTYLRYKPQPNS